MLSVPVLGVVMISLLTPPWGRVNYINKQIKSNYVQHLSVNILVLDCGRCNKSVTVNNIQDVKVQVVNIYPCLYIV